MESRKLAVVGALGFTAPTFTDERGLFVSPFQEVAFMAALRP
jgi:epimerase EvaD